MTPILSYPPPPFLPPSPPPPPPLAYGFEKPSAIQQRAIKPVIDGRDIIAQAPSGTGKTGTFAISLFQRLDINDLNCQALILVPTCELAQQIQKVTAAIGEFLKVKVHACGNTNVEEEMQVLRDGVHILVGTPDCVCEMLKRNVLPLNKLKFLVLDEADKLLGRRFKEQPMVFEICDLLPSDTQISLFSATISAEALDLTSKFKRNFQHIIVKNEDLTLNETQNIKQFFVATTENEKLDTLVDLMNTLSLMHTIIYCNTPDRVAYQVTEMLRGLSIQPPSSMHGGMTQDARELMMENFRTGVCRVLITDKFKRGIDVVKFASLVLYYDLPRTCEQFIQRIDYFGRFRRGSKSGVVNFVTPLDMALIQDVEGYYKTQIEEVRTGRRRGKGKKKGGSILPNILLTHSAHAPPHPIPSHSLPNQAKFISHSTSNLRYTYLIIYFLPP